MAETLLAGTGVARRFPQGAGFFDALLPVDFEVRSGDRIAIVGPSGGGKSTLLQLMAGLDRPSAGTLRWPALGLREQLRPEHVGVVFQAANLLPTLSAVENVEIPVRLLARHPQPRTLALAALERVGLAALADKLPGELSGGQAQRVGLARAIVLQPRLVLADEPTGQLDQATAQTVIGALLQALQDSDAALVLATHDDSVAQRLAARWTLAHGRLTLPGGRA
ncbi:MAG: ATP-binding cassette domain-containing protein [Burkholderiales bacterium]|nr:ATP-binding cassette domain-containing protein [Burkholderiales bacterium]MDE2276169.1 ATP-binding cassette domain-containing protein [Burkholderiales bacterium]